MEEIGVLTMLVKATITQLATLESLTVLWNPQGYAVRRVNRFAAPSILGAGPDRASMSAGGVERFATRLLLDSTRERGPRRDLRLAVDALERWGEPAEGGLPPELLFSWGSFRFRGRIEDLLEEWIRFDPDGVPVRGWVTLTLRR